MPVLRKYSGRITIKRSAKGCIHLYFIALFFILSGWTVYHYVNPPVISVQATKMILYIACLLYILRNGFSFHRSIFFALGVGAYIFLYSVLSWKEYEYIWYVISRICIPFILFILFASELIRRNQLKRFFLCFENTMVTIATISVFCWVFGTNLRLLPFRAEGTYTWANRTWPTATYLGLYWETQSVESSLLAKLSMKRNCGIFTEAPGYAFYLDLAFMIELLSKRRINIKKMAILLITMVTSFSVKACLIALVGIYLKMILLTAPKSKFHQVFRLMIMPIFAVVAMFIASTIVADKMSTGSGSARTEFLLAGVAIWMKNPLFGIGFTDNEEILNSLVGLDFLGTMGFTTFMAFGGLYMTLLYFGSLFAASSSNLLKNKKKELLIASILLGIEWFISSVYLQSAFMFIISLGYATLAEERTNSVYKPEASLPTALKRKQIKESAKQG